MVKSIRYGFCILVVCWLAHILFGCQSVYGQDVTYYVVPYHSSYVVVAKSTDSGDGITHLYVSNATLAYRPPRHLPPPPPLHRPPRPLPPPPLPWW